MSTDQTKTNHSTAAGKPDSAAGSTSRPDLSPTKIIGGALAAMTAAALGAQLSVVGTVVGAAVASIVAAVASALYTASLERTGSRVRRIWRRGDVVVVTDPVTVAPEAAADEPNTATTRRRLSWSRVLAGALAAFGLAAVALTGIELVTGQALSGGDGTTVSQVSRGDDRPSKPADDATPSPSEEETASDEPTSSPTAEASPMESNTPEPRTVPTGTPSSPTPTETETEPAPSATPGSTSTGGTATQEP